MQTIFTTIYDFFRNRKVFCLVLIALLTAFLIAGSWRIRLEQDINSMIPHDPTIEAMNEVLNKTRTGEQLIFTASFTDTAYQNPDSLILLQETFKNDLFQKSSDYLAAEEGKADDREQEVIEIINEHLPVFLDDNDYKRIDSLITAEKIAQKLKKQMQVLQSPAGLIARPWITSDPLGIKAIVLQKIQALKFDPNYERYNNSIFSKDRKSLIFFLSSKYKASETGKNALLMHSIDDLIGQWKTAHPQFKVSYFGGPAVAAANAQQLKKDTYLTLSLTIVLLIGLTYYVFRHKRAPVLLLTPVIFGGLFGLSVVALIQGSISIIALGAGSIILGIAIDFSVHFMSHHRLHSDMRENVKALAMPLTLGALTTIGAFLALRLADTPLLQDLGLFASMSLAGAALFTLIFLPHLIGEQYHTKKLEHRETLIDKLAKYRPEKSKILLLLVVVVTPILWHYSDKVSFDDDLMHLNYLSPELKKAQEELNENNSYALGAIFVVSKENSEEKARQNLEAISPLIVRLTKEGKIKNAINPVQLLPSANTQNERIQKWDAYWNTGRASATIAAIQNECAHLGLNKRIFSSFESSLTKSYSSLDSTATNVLKQMMPGNQNKIGETHYWLSSLKVEKKDRKAVLNAFAAFDEVKATDRQSVSEKLLSLLQEDFNTIIFYSAALVFLALLIAYGRIELALISFLPMALTWVWILGLMALLGLKFNIVSIVIATLIFGLGDDYSIFMMDSLLERYRTGKQQIQHARSAVYLSVLTTIIGLGTLIFAKHPALQSIAATAIVGLICVVFVSQSLQPFLFNFLIQHRADKGFMPFTLWSLTKSTFSFLYFFTGCIIVTICGFVLIGIKPFGKKRSKYVFHFILSRYTGSVMYIMANLRKRIIIPDKNIFNKPAVYIANHSSFLDILLTTMLHPKLVLLTNKWVWRSPAFGRIVRMAEYYPVADGAEESIEPLRDLVNRGYGIVVFPEGTRSYDDTIHRFHKGAFYIAEKLQLDIVPLIMHGVNYTMQKGDWLLKDGTTTVKMLAPVKPNDPAFGQTYSEKTKSVSKFFRAEFQKEKLHMESPSYFREQIVKSNLYKGPVLEWYCRIKVGLEKNYETFHNLLPRKGNFYDLGCGYGFMTYMLHWASEERNFIGVDYDDDKITTALNNYKRLQRWPIKAYPNRDSTVDKGIRFEQADLNDYSLEECDGVIISDVLHYLKPEEQLNLLNKAYEATKPDGLIILRDGVKDLEHRHRGTKLSEILSTKIVRFNKTKQELHFINRELIEKWADQKKLRLTILDHSKNTSNLIFVLNK